MGALIAESVDKFQGIQKQWKRAIKEIEHTDKKILKEYSYYQSFNRSAGLSISTTENVGWIFLNTP